MRIVQKYGGTSLADAQRVQAAAERDWEKEMATETED